MSSAPHTTRKDLPGFAELGRSEPSPIDRYGHARDRARLAGLARFVNRLGGTELFYWLARLTYRFAIEGEANIPATGPCLFVCNHESLLTDALIYVTLVRRRPGLYVFAWHNLQDERPMYGFMSHYGETGLEERYLRAYKARALSAGELLRARGVLQAGGSIMIAPEGELTWDGQFQYPLTPGAAWLGLRSGATLVPIVTTGGYDIQPRWQLRPMRLTGRIALCIGQPFTLGNLGSSDLTRQTLEEASQRIWAALDALRRSLIQRRR